MLKINDLIAKSKNGTEIIVSLIPLNKIQNTRNGLKTIEVGKRILLQSGALLHKDLKCKAPLIEPNLRRNLGKWST
ncbi:hypothetical protein N5C10_18470 [Acinetobacter johnsonii]|uniref:Transposase n=1 Tax=Acinetobacter johnsonii TaxID=40214 RepID=A0AA42MWG1_ACIJO|nr:hypothetical protein [Acinetobacter johnsonii]MDH0971130.1 hypothetical protein [Acinetobacter johnsonii]